MDDREPAYSGLLLDASPHGGEDGLLQVHEIFNLRLDEGALVSSRRAGDEMAFARQELEKDLR